MANTAERSGSSGLQRNGSGASPQRHAALHASTPPHRSPSHANGPWDSASDPQRQHQQQQQEQQRQQRAASGVADDKGLTSSSSAVLLSYSPPSSSRRRTPHYKSPMDDECCSLTLGPVLNVAGALENSGPVPSTAGQLQQAHMHMQMQGSTGGAADSALNSGGGSFKDNGSGTLARAMSADTGYLAAASAGGGTASHRNTSSAGGAGSASRRAPGKRASMLSREGRAAPVALPGQAAAAAWMAMQGGSDGLATSGGGGDAGASMLAATGSDAQLHMVANEVERSHASMLMELQREIYGSPDRSAAPAGSRLQLLDGGNGGSGGGGGGVQSGAALREYSKSLDLRRPYPYSYRYGQQPPIPPGASGAGLSVKAPASGSGVHAESMMSAAGLAGAASGAASSSATVTAVAAAVLAAAEEGDGFSSALPGFEHLDEYSRKHSREWYGGGLSSLSSFGGMGGAAPGSTPWASAGRAARHSIDVHSLLALQQGVLSPDSPTRQQRQQQNVVLPQLLSQSQHALPRHRVTLQHQPSSGIAGIPAGGLSTSPQQAMPSTSTHPYPPSWPTSMDRSASGPAAAAAAAAAASAGGGAAGGGSVGGAGGSALRRAATQAGAQLLPSGAQMLPSPRSQTLATNTSQTDNSSSGALSGTVSAGMRAYAQQQMVQEQQQQQQPGPGGHLAIPRALSAEPGALPPSHQQLVAFGVPLSYRLVCGNQPDMCGRQQIP